MTITTETADRVRIKQFGCLPYQSVWQQMQAFTNNRDSQSADEIWLLEHLPVYTQGQAGKAEHLLFAGDIPVVKSDRGGQITYHGPGQLIAYLLIDLRRRQLGVRKLVTLIEQAIIEMLAEFGVTAETRDKAPGVYVEQKKIASLGLRVRKGCTYHGLSLNLNMDLTPFSGINVCGYQGMQVTRLCDLVGEFDEQLLRERLLDQLLKRLGYSDVQYVENIDE